MDHDGDGRLGKDEVRTLLTPLMPLVTQERIDQMFDEADTAKDGTLSFEEFYAYSEKHPQLIKGFQACAL